MKTTDLESPIETIAQARVDRRKFFRQAGYFGLGAAVTGLALNGTSAKAQISAQSQDTVAEILTAFLIAEDLATTFYYNGLVGAVIQDPNLAGPGGSATKVTSGGNVGNVDYLRAALYQEVQHANLFRLRLSGYVPAERSPSADPYQTFYFPARTFDTLGNFLGVLNALENAFIGAYLVLVQEFSKKAALARAGALTGPDAKISESTFELYAKIAASILGVESEHRVLGRVIGNLNPANNYAYEQVDGITSIYNGTSSAVVALTPFLTPSTGPGFSFATAVNNQASISLKVNGGFPDA